MAEVKETERETTDQDMPFDKAQDVLLEEDEYHAKLDEDVRKSTYLRATKQYLEKEKDKKREPLQANLIDTLDFIERGEINNKIKSHSLMLKEMDTQIKNKDLKLQDQKHEDDDLIPFFNIESENKTIEEQKEEQQKQLKKMFTETPDIDEFIVDAFSNKGMQNIYGKHQEVFTDSEVFGEVRKQEQKKWPSRFKRDVELVDCKISTHFVEDIIYYVVIGYQKGYKFNDWTWSQGRSILRIYQMDPQIEKKDRQNEKGYLLPENLIFDEVLNNVDFKYSSYKNYNPVLVHNNCLYFYKVDNHFHGKNPQHFIDFWLFEFDLEQRKDGKLNRKPQRKELYCYRDVKDDYFVTHVSFIIPYPQSQLTQDELKDIGGGIMYFKERDLDRRINKTGEEYSNYKIQRIGMRRHNSKPKDVKIMHFNEEIEFKIEQEVLELSYPQLEHIWVIKDGLLQEVSQNNTANMMYHEIKKGLYSKPYYYTKKQDGFNYIKQFAKYDEDKDYDYLIQVFDMHDEIVMDNRDDQDSQDEDDAIDYKELQSISIIDDNENFKFLVFYVYGNEIEFKRYTHQRKKPMTKYNFSELTPMEKFAIKYDYGQVDKIFMNVFQNYHQPTKEDQENQRTDEYQAFMVYNDEVLKIQMEDDDYKRKFLNQYKVHDIINDKEVYNNIARIENEADNPYIRFKIVGGENEGLSIRFSRFKDDATITDYKIMTFFTQEKYQNAGLAWSSDMYKLNPRLKKTHNGKICQNIQWAQMHLGNIFCQIIEYEISWPKDLNEMTPDKLKLLQNEEKESEFQISILGMKVVLFNNLCDFVKPGNWFYSMYDNESNRIIGTQWLPDCEKISKDNEREGIFYQLPIYDDNEYQYETKMVRSCLYQYYSDKTKSDKFGYIVIESQIADDLDKQYHKFRKHEVLDILLTELRCLLNMKMTTIEDIIDVNTSIHDYDFLQSMECLGRYSIADFFLLDPEQIQKFTSKVDPHKKYRSISILDDFIRHQGNLLSSRRFFLHHGLLRPVGSVSFDRDHFNTLYRCFDNQSTLKQLIEVQQEQFNVLTFKDKVKNFFSYETKNQVEEKNQQEKQKAVLQMSGNHILNYVLKKKPTPQENRMIFFLLDLLIEKEIQIERFFENISMFGTFMADPDHKQLLSLIEMDSIPASSEDIATMRILGIRNKHTKDFDGIDDMSYLQRFFNNYRIQNRVHNEDQLTDQTSLLKFSADQFFYDTRYKIGQQDYKMHRIQNFLFDRSSIHLDLKKLQLLNLQTKTETAEQRKSYMEVTNQEDWDLYDLSKYLGRIHNVYGKHVESHPVIMKITDSLFEDSYWFYIKQMALYDIYMIPFGLQLIYFDHMSDKGLSELDDFYKIGESEAIVRCNIACLCIAFIFFIIELIQINELGFKVYVSDKKAYELLWFPFQVVYFVLKIYFPHETYPLIDYVVSAEVQDYKQRVWLMALYAILNTVLLALICAKLFDFSTINHRFGTMITLITQTYDTIGSFFTFYIGMLFVFSCTMICLGYDMTPAFLDPTKWKEAEYGRRIWNENSIAQYFVNNFLNSVGQVSSPSLYLWNHIVKDDEAQIKENFPGLDDYSKGWAQIMQIVCWAFWVVIVIFLFIILINFMIAYITQSYEDVLEKKIKNIYQQKCELNNEYYLFRRFLHNCCGKKIKRFQMQKWDTFLLSADFNINLGKSEESGNIGVIKNVQQQLVIDKEEIKNEVQQNRSEMERVQLEMRQYRYAMDNIITDLPHIKEEITKSFKSLVDKNNFNLIESLNSREKMEPLQLKEEAKQANQYETPIKE